jgi:hypothetical protein
LHNFFEKLFWLHLSQRWIGAFKYQQSILYFFLTKIYKMSKSSYAPGELIGTIKFVFDKTKSRTLNATQAYDSNPSQIVLASYPATATKKAPTKSLGTVYGIGKTYGGTAIVAGITYGADAGGAAGTNKEVNTVAGGKELTLSFSPIILTGPAVGSKKAGDPAVFYPTGSTAIFTSSAVNSGRLVGSSKRKSSANKDIFYGAITVGTVLYKEWQGKYAVLKVDLLTNNAILRVYNE